MATPLPVSFTFRAGQQEQLTWTLTDPTGAPITGVTVVASLYENRNRQNPADTPGTIVTNFNNISLAETPALSGIYVGTIPASLNPTSATVNYVLVVTATSGAVTLGTWERPAVVVSPQLVQDLILLDDLKDWLQIAQSNTDDDNLLQLLISSFSQFFLNQTGIESFKQIIQYTEVLDGNGNRRIYVNNPPIVSLTSVTIGNWGAPISTSLVSPGVFLEQGGRSIAFRDPGYAGPLFPAQSIYPYYFPRGQGNIQIVYMGGYASVPFDIQQAAMDAIGVAYKRKDTIDLASKALSAGGGASGTTRYRDWAFTPYVQQIISFYSRYARP